MADMARIMEIARKHKLIVIEDAAQAIGAELNHMRAGSMGHAGCFSFYPSKNLGGFGDAGMITTNDADLASRIRLLRSHGFRAKYFSERVGGNFRLDEIQAAVLRVKLKYLDRWIEARRRNAGFYRESLSGSDTIKLPYEMPHSRHTYNQFVIRTLRRDELIAQFKQRQIGFEVYYPLPLHLQTCFKGLGYRVGDFPASEAAARESLALPIYAELTAEMLQAVADAL